MGSLLRKAEPDKSDNREKFWLRCPKQQTSLCKGFGPNLASECLSKELFGKDFSGERPRIFAGHTYKALLAGSSPLFYVTVPVATQGYLDHFSFIVSFKIRQ